MQPPLLPPCMDTSLDNTHGSTRSSALSSYVPEAEDEGEIEEARLEKMGYKQELHRGFNAFMAFSFCFTAVAGITLHLFTSPLTLSPTLSSGICHPRVFSQTAMATGGPVIIVWSWVIGSALSVLIALSMAEICSTYPSAGSVYHWAGNLAPKKYGPLAAYVTGWFNFLGNAAGDAFYGFTFACKRYSHYISLFNSCNVIYIASINALLVSTCKEEMVLDEHTGVMSSPCSISNEIQCIIGIVVYIVWSLQNLLRVDHQGHINNFASFFQVASTFAIIITLLGTCGTNHATDAFGHDINATRIASASQIFLQFNNGITLTDLSSLINLFYW